MPVITTPQTVAAAHQPDEQNRVQNSNRAPDLQDTAAQGLRQVESTVLRGSDPIQKASATTVDNDTIHRQNLTAATESESQAAQQQDDFPIRYVKRPQPSAVERAGQPEQGQTSAQREKAHLVVESHRDNIAESLDIKA